MITVYQDNLEAINLEGKLNKLDLVSAIRNSSVAESIKVPHELAVALRVEEVIRSSRGPIIRYFNDRILFDINHTAIFTAGAVNMTVATTTQERDIVFYTIVPSIVTQIVDTNGHEFMRTDLNDNQLIETSTDQTLLVDQVMTRGRMIFNAPFWEVTQ